MLKEGLINLQIQNRSEIEATIINNSINCSFYNNHYQFNSGDKKADFITIRPLDGRKYAVDKVVELAKIIQALLFIFMVRVTFFNIIPNLKTLLFLIILSSRKIYLTC